MKGQVYGSKMDTSQKRFEEDCKTFENLIDEGKRIASLAPSLNHSNRDDRAEQTGFKWFVTARNFLSDLFGEGFRDTITFRKCFGSYTSYNLFGEFFGTFTFVKEDVEKGVGVLEGTYESFKNSRIARKDELIKSLIRSTDKIRVMFDNDILNKLTQGELDLDKLKSSNKFEFYATHIQTDQVSRCNDSEKRAKLTLTLTKLAPIIIPTESGIFGISRFGEFKFSGENSKIEDLRQGNANHNEDSLIGETAIKKGILLITNDKTLKSRVNANGGRAINLDEFKEIISTTRSAAD